MAASGQNRGVLIVAIIHLDDGLISDPFEIAKDGLTFKDALVMPKAQYDAMTPEEIEVMKQRRFDNWYALVTAVSEEPAGTQE